MNVLIFGKKDPVQTDIIEYLQAAGHRVIRAKNRNNIPSQKFDICVDTSTHSASLLRTGLTNVSGKVSHYILISSHRVYPDLPRDTPWDPNDINLGDESGFSGLPDDIRVRRAVERELRLLSSRSIPWTILRPAIVETTDNPDQNIMQWFVTRILDGGPVILPDAEEPLFRHVSGRDLTRAIISVAGQKQAFSEILHVVDQGIFTCSSYAKLLMRVLDRHVPIKMVPATQWESANLELPGGGHLHSSFINDSRLLRKLGWEPADETMWVHEYAARLRVQPEESSSARSAELALLDLPEPLVVQHHSPEEDLCFVAKPGEANSFRPARLLPGKENSFCRLKTLSFSMGIAEEQFLLNHPPENTTRVLGHTALLELIDSGKNELPGNKLYIPIAERPCGTQSCTLCQETASGMSGINEDGYAQSFVFLPPEHLVPVPGDMRNIALLADPLACLLSVLPGLLEEDSGTIWIFGHRVEAALADLIIREAGHHPPINIYRTNISPARYFGSGQSFSIQTAKEMVEAGKIEAPTLILNVSGSRDGDNLLSKSLSEGGVLISPFIKTAVHPDVLHAQLPLSAPGRYWLEEALHQLDCWKTQFELERLMQKVALENYWDLFLPEYFRQPYMQFSGGAI